MTVLEPGDFAAFFEEVHGHEPFPWQTRLLEHVIEHDGEWPDTLDLPTGSGKTAAIDIATFHLALEAERGAARLAPVRIVFVVDRRLVVDDAFERARKLANALNDPGSSTVERVAEQLKKLSGDGPALIARRLRGGIPREDDWARTPSQPTILCSTVDQVGSRLLFRGYGITDRMKPVHAGLLGSDALILLDEAHLAEPFRQTLGWVRTYRGPKWREAEEAAPWGVILLTATPGESASNRDADGSRETTFKLDSLDRAHPLLAKRLNASKPARLIPPVGFANQSGDEVDDAEGPILGGNRHDATDLAHRVEAIVEEVSKARRHFAIHGDGVPAPVIGVVVNRVARARAVIRELHRVLAKEIATETISSPILMIGPARSVDRSTLVEELAPIRTQGRTPRPTERALIIVATQCIEVGVDIDFDALITELAPLDALRQRFGRLNRAGREIAPYAAIVASKRDIASRYVDHVYGSTLRPTWEALKTWSTKSDAEPVVEFGIEGFPGSMTADVVAERADAPVLLPAHLDLLSQTSPIPLADPDVGLYLHGPSRAPDAVTVVWRADIGYEAQSPYAIRRLLTLVPPRSAEAIQLPVWTVRKWLRGEAGAADDLADVAAPEPEEERQRRHYASRQAFLWKGDDERSKWIDSGELNPGDTIVVPTSYGGMDKFGWDPDDAGTSRAISDSSTTVDDVGREAAVPFAQRKFAVRVAPGLVGESVSDGALADALANAASTAWPALVDVLLDLPLPQSLEADLELLRTRKARNVVAYLDLDGEDEAGRPRRVVFVVSRGIEEAPSRPKRSSTTGSNASASKTEVSSSENELRSYSAPNTTEDDHEGSTPGYLLDLSTHLRDVEARALEFARAAGLSDDRVADLQTAGALHDLGKADSRFQSWLHYGDPLGPDPDDPKQLLAKSARRLPRNAHYDSGLPDHWRHEALSVRLAAENPRFSDARDPELVLWLIGVHHGFGRPLFPHSDPTETAPDVGPQSLAFDWNGLDWPSLHARLQARYGTWELARMEAVLRLADHRASEMRATEGSVR
jgi:CRISPR-associated endonuclease/helicase Cas3